MTGPTTELVGHAIASEEVVVVPAARAVKQANVG